MHMNFKRMHRIVYSLAILCLTTFSCGKTDSGDSDLSQKYLNQPCTTTLSQGVTKILYYDRSKSVYRQELLYDSGDISKELTYFTIAEGDTTTLGIEEFNRAGQVSYKSELVQKPILIEIEYNENDEPLIILFPEVPKNPFSRAIVRFNDESNRNYVFGEGNYVRVQPTSLKRGKNYVEGTFVDFDIVHYDNDSIGYEIGEASTFQYEFEYHE